MLVAEHETAKYFETAVEGRDGKMVANWVTGTLFGALKKSGLTIENVPITAENLGRLTDLISQGTISGRIAKQVFDIMFGTGKDPETIVKERGFKQITNAEEIWPVVDQIINENPEQVAQVKGGNTKTIGWFVGQVMQKTKGEANPNLVNKTPQTLFEVLHHS